MTSTRRRKIAHSVAIRRVKAHKSRILKPKLPKHKTFRRKSRNTVMRGGKDVNEDLQVYVIQKKLGRLKFLIIRKKNTHYLDTIYLFFDGEDNNELKDFVCAALELDADNFELPLPEDTNKSLFKNVFYKLSGKLSAKFELSKNPITVSNIYTLSSGPLSDTTKKKIPGIPVTTIEYTSKSQEKVNGSKIIERLQNKTDTYKGYTFMDITEELKSAYTSYLKKTDFTLEDIRDVVSYIVQSTIQKVRDTCMSDKPFINKINELRDLIKKKETTRAFISNEEYKWDREIEIPSDATTRNKYIERVKQTLEQTKPFLTENANRVIALIDEIKNDENFETYKILFSKDFEDLEKYFGKLDNDEQKKEFEELIKKFKGYEEMIKEAFMYSRP